MFSSFKFRLLCLYVFFLLTQKGWLMSMKRFIVVLCFIGLGLSSCADDNQSPTEARTLWERINAEDYHSFSRAPGYETTQPSAAPHGNRVDIYVNDVVQNVLDAGEAINDWPVGSLIVKDGFDADGKLDIVAVMDKQDNGWFYAEWIGLESDEASYSGQPAVCVNCHASGADEVRAFGFPAPQ